MSNRSIAKALIISITLIHIYVGYVSCKSSTILSQVQTTIGSVNKLTNVITSNAYKTYKNACLTGLYAIPGKVDIHVMQLCEDEARAYEARLKRDLR